MPDGAAYSSREEFANALTHGAGFLIAVAALVHMIDIAPVALSGWQKTGVIVYGLSLMLMFLASTLYHAISQPEAKLILKRVDHCAIFLLIAGSYTPILSIAVQSELSNMVLITVWSMAGMGTVFKLFFAGRFQFVSISVYLIMGWLSLIVVYQVYQALEPAGFALLLGGGIAYTVGVVFYAVKSIPFNHAIWHGFVLIGALSHCWLIAEYVVNSGHTT